MSRKQLSPLQKAINLWALILLVWGLYRYFFKTELPIWFDEFITKPIVFIVPVYYFITRVEKQKFSKGLDFHKKTFLNDFLMGLSIGLIFLLISALSSIKTLNIDWSQFQQKFTHGSMPILLLTAFATSISEEIVSRGFILKRLYENSKNVLQSVVLASLLFFFLHIPILLTSPSIMGIELLQVMANDFLLSCAISFLYLQTRSLTVPILVHAFYTISIYFFHLTDS